LRLYLAEAQLFSGEFNSALNELESLLSCQELLDNANSHIHLLNLQSLTLVQLQNFNEAMLCSEVAQDIAKKTGNKQHLAQTMFINFFVHDKASQTMFINFFVHDKALIPLNLHEFESLDINLQHFNMSCSLLYLLRNYHSYLHFYNHLQSHIAIKSIQRALKLARKIGHKQCVAICYHNKQLGESKNQIQMFNGIGYFNTLLEQYAEAQNEYLKAYNIARLGRNYSELTITIYNLAWLYFSTNHYQRANDILVQAIRICRVRDITHFPFHNLHDLFSLKGLCHAKLGEFASAKQYLERIQALPFKPSRTAEFLQALLKGLQYKAENKLALARKVFENAPDILDRAIDKKSSLIPQCNCELLEVYSRQEDWEACQLLIKSSLRICRKFSLARFVKIFLSMEKNVQLQNIIYSNDIPPFPLPDILLQLNEVVFNAKQERQLQQAQQRLREMQLISRMQLLHNHFNNSQSLSDESLKLLCSSFTVQAGTIHLFNNQQWALYSQTGRKQTNKKITTALTHVKEEQTPWIENLFCSQGEGGKRATYDSTICLPIFIDQQLHAAITLCNFNRNRYFDNQTVDILQLICRQLGNQLEQIKHQENLLKMSTTDPLTKLFNRQALLTRLEQELLLCQQNKGHYHCALAYIDLDNFKMVNDKLGHDVGDKVLKKFADMLTHTMRSEDIVARWGGDEFVVLFPNANHQQAKRTC